MRKNMRARGHQNREMNPETYKLRRKVIDLVYEAKRISAVELPRIDVRITDCNREGTLGTARMGDRIVWIPATSTDRDDLRHIVFHEILHAVFGQPHVKGCPLMDAHISKVPTSEIDRLFRHYTAKIFR